MELKLYFELVLEELGRPHLECIPFLSVKLQWYLKGPLLLYGIVDVFDNAEAYR